MNRLRLPLPVLLLGAVLACALAAARSASADEAEEGVAAPASPLARLHADEQQAVRAKIPGFESLPLEKQEQVVRNVEWLRSADPAVREMVKRRVQQANAAHLGGQQVAGRVTNFGNLPGPRQGVAFHHGLALSGLGRIAWLDLPAEIRDDPQARMVEQPFAVAFHRKFWWRAFRALDAQAALDFAPAPDLPAEMLKRLKDLRAEAEARRSDPKAAEKALGRLKEAVLQAQAFLATRDLISALPNDPRAPRNPAVDARRLLALGERLRNLARPAYDATRNDFVTKWGEMTPRAWAESVVKLAQPPEPPPEVRRKVEALQAAFALESLGAFVARHPSLATPADALLKKALVDELGMPVEEFARLPARGEGLAQEQRMQVLKQWLEGSGLPREILRQALQQAWQKRWQGPAGNLPGRGKPGGGAPPRSPEKRPGEERRKPPDDEKK